MLFGHIDLDTKSSHCVRFLLSVKMIQGKSIALLALFENCSKSSALFCLRIYVYT